MITKRISKEEILKKLGVASDDVKLILDQEWVSLSYQAKVFLTECEVKLKAAYELIDGADHEAAG